MPDANLTGSPHITSCFEPCGSLPDAPWLCLYTVPQGENVALQNLRRQDFPAYLPLHLVTKANRQTVIEPLFPRYILAQPHRGSWSAMRGTRGVSSVLCKPNGEAREFPGKDITRLFAQCAPNGVIYPKPPPDFEINDTVRITSGPFAEWTGICSRSAKDRIWLLLEVMGRPREIAFPRTVLEPV